MCEVYKTQGFGFAGQFMGVLLFSVPRHLA